MPYPHSMIHTLFNKISSLLTRLLFPQNCAGCRKEGVFLCAPCASSIHVYAPSCFICNSRRIDAALCAPCKRHTFYSHFYAPFSYKDEKIREMIYRLKYRRVKPYASVLAALLSRAIARWKLALPKESVIVPIPLHRSRFFERDFNQSSLIGEALSAALTIQCAPDYALIRNKKTPPQVSMPDTEARIKNVVNAFSVRDATPFYKKHVLLVDDVATTGSTINEAAKVLKAAGARSVWVFTIAR